MAFRVNVDRPEAQPRTETYQVPAWMAGDVPEAVGAAMADGGPTTAGPSGPVDFAAATKQVAERKVCFYGFVVDAHHLEEMLERLIGLLVEEKIQALQIIDVERRRCLFFFPLAKPA